MVKTIDIQDMRYLNLFGRTTKVQTRFCFRYNDIVFFCVPKSLISKAIGENGRNIKKMNEITKKKIKIISIPKDMEEISGMKKFIEDIVSPLTFKDLGLQGDEIVLTAGAQSKAALIGRNKRRLNELKQISRDYFGKELRII